MKKKPKSKCSLWVRGSDGKHYAGYYESGQLFTKAPGWVTYTGWRKSLPNTYRHDASTTAAPEPNATKL